MQNLLLGNWQTTTIGFLAALLTYFTQNGAKFPETKQEWGTALLSAAMVALGVAAKDGNVGSKAK